MLLFGHEADIDVIKLSAGGWIMTVDGGEWLFASVAVPRTESLGRAMIDAVSETLEEEYGIPPESSGLTWNPTWLTDAVLRSEEARYAARSDQAGEEFLFLMERDDLRQVGEALTFMEDGWVPWNDVLFGFPERPGPSSETFEALVPELGEGIYLWDKSAGVGTADLLFLPYRAVPRALIGPAKRAEIRWFGAYPDLAAFSGGEWVLIARFADTGGVFYAAYEAYRTHRSLRLAAAVWRECAPADALAVSAFFDDLDILFQARIRGGAEGIATGRIGPRIPLGDDDLSWRSPARRGPTVISTEASAEIASKTAPSVVAEVPREVLAFAEIAAEWRESVGMNIYVWETESGDYVLVTYPESPRALAVSIDAMSSDIDEVYSIAESLGDDAVAAVDAAALLHSLTGGS